METTYTGFQAIQSDWHEKIFRDSLASLSATDKTKVKERKSAMRIVAKEATKNARRQIMAGEDKTGQALIDAYSMSRTGTQEGGKITISHVSPQNSIQLYLQHPLQVFQDTANILPTANNQARRLGTVSAAYQPRVQMLCE